MEGDLGVYRRTIDEYVLRCEQGVDIREVLAESALDRDFYADALRRWGRSDVAVYDASFVHVEEDVVRRAGFTPGVKGTLQAVAAALAESGVMRSGSGADVVIIVDRDYEDSETPLEGSEPLLFTDGYSVESYVLSAAALDRYVRLVLGRGDGREGPPSDRVVCSGHDLFDRVVPAAAQLAGVRLTLRELDPPPRVFARWEGYVAVAQNGVLSADPDALLKNVLESHPIHDWEEDHRVTLVAHSGRAAADPRSLVRGHDFVCLLLKVLCGSRWGRAIAEGRLKGHTEDSLTRALLGSLDTGWLDRQPLFRALQTHFGVPVGEQTG